MKQLTYGEGYIRGKQDKERKYEKDPYRWAKAWAPNWDKFVRGYEAGYHDLECRP